MNFALFVVITPIFYCQLPAVGFLGLRPKVVSRALTELRKGSQTSMARKGLAHCATLRSQVQRTKENRVSAREDNDSRVLK